jgi:hypothetical protein
LAIDDGGLLVDRSDQQVDRRCVMVVAYPWLSSAC